MDSNNEKQALYPKPDTIPLRNTRTSKGKLRTLLFHIVFITLSSIFALRLWYTFQLNSPTLEGDSALLAKAHNLLEKHPLIDAHGKVHSSTLKSKVNQELKSVDLPIQIRIKYAYQMDQVALDQTLEIPFMHVDIPRLKKGKLGAAVWSVFVPCAEDIKLDEGPNFTTSTWRVR